MQKYVCGPCGYEYDPEVGDPDNGIAPGTAFEDLPEDWVCPICGVGAEMFEKITEQLSGKGSRVMHGFLYAKAGMNGKTPRINQR